MKGTEFKVHCLEIVSMTALFLSVFVCLFSFLFSTESLLNLSCLKVINALYYNPLLTLRILEEHQWTQGFFTLWFQTLEKFSRVHDKKLVIVALCSLLELPTEQLPASLQAGWSEVLNGIVNVFKTLPRAVESEFSDSQLIINNLMYSADSP